MGMETAEQTVELPWSTSENNVLVRLRAASVNPADSYFRQFGTYLKTDGRWPETYGVVGKPLPRGFLSQHLYPFIAEPKSTPDSST